MHRLICAFLLVLMNCAAGFAQDTATNNVTFGKPQKLHSGFGFVEGPAANAAGDVYFTDIPNERIHVIRTDGTLETALENSDKCNGLMFDATGRLWACQGGKGRIVQIDLKTGEFTPVASTIDGGPFLSTNDLALDAHGGAYFTDPAYWRHPDAKVGEGVYYVAADGAITRLADSYPRPNGVLLSPKGDVLYLLPAGEKRLVAYDITAPGKLGPAKTLARLKGGGDGLTVATDGTLFLTQPRSKSILAVAPDGTLLGEVKLPESPANVAFGGKNMDTLFVTARTSVYSIPVNRRGLVVAQDDSGKTSNE